MKRLPFAFAMAAMILSVVATDSGRTGSRVAAAPQTQTYTIPEAGIQFQLPTGCIP